LAKIQLGEMPRGIAETDNPYYNRIYKTGSLCSGFTTKEPCDCRTWSALDKNDSGIRFRLLVSATPQRLFNHQLLDGFKKEIKAEQNRTKPF